MANYVVKEMPKSMGDGRKGRTYPKMQVYTEFDYDKVVELVNTYSPSFSKATIRGVLDTLSVVMKSYLPMGHTLKIDNLGVFSLSLQYADNDADGADSQAQEAVAPKSKYRRVEIRGVNFKVDKKLVKEMNKDNTFERVADQPASASPYSQDERLKRALRHIDKHGFVTLQEYSNLNKLSRSSASRELARLVADSSSGIAAKGAGSHKFWVRRG